MYNVFYFFSKSIDKTFNICYHLYIKERGDFMKKFFEKVFFVFVFVFCLYLCYDIFFHIEKYSSTMRYSLLLDINKGDKEALKYYKETYTDNNIYLYNGEISFGLFYENIKDETKETYNQVYAKYINSDLSLQDFSERY